MAIGTLWTPEPYLTDSTGAPLAGGKVYFYATGTLTPQDTYTTAAVNVANANPVVLDSAGRASIFLKTTLVYKAIVKTSADVEIYTNDGIYPSGYVAPNVVLADSQTGAINNWVPTGGLSGSSVLVAWNGATDAAVTGLAGGVTGQTVTIRNGGSGGILTLAHNSSSSTSANRFFNMVTSAATPVAAGGSITYQYDGSEWLCTAHEQGAWITPTFAAGNYTALASGTWTLASGDVSVNKYHLAGKALDWNVLLTTTSVGQSGGGPTQLVIAAASVSPFTITDLWKTTCLIGDNSTTLAAGIAVSTGNVIIQKLDQSQFASATNTTSVQLNTTMQVT